MRSKWTKFQEAEKAFCNTDEPIKHIARRLDLSPATVLNFLHALHPEVVLRRREARLKKETKETTKEE